MQSVTQQVLYVTEEKTLPLLAKIPDKGLYWVEWNICNYNWREVTNGISGKKNLFVSLHNEKGPSHMRYYPVVRDREVYDKFAEFLAEPPVELTKEGYRMKKYQDKIKLKGWRLCNGESITNPEKPSSTVWELVYERLPAEKQEYKILEDGLKPHKYSKEELIKKINDCPKYKKFRENIIKRKLSNSNRGITNNC